MDGAEAPASPWHKLIMNAWVSGRSFHGMEYEVLNHREAIGCEDCAATFTSISRAAARAWSSAAATGIDAVSRSSDL